MLGDSTELGAWELWGPGIIWWDSGTSAIWFFPIIANDTTLRYPCSSVLGFGGNRRIGNSGAWGSWCLEIILWDP